MELLKRSDSDCEYSALEDVIIEFPIVSSQICTSISSNKRFYFDIWIFLYVMIALLVDVDLPLHIRKMAP